MKYVAGLLALLIVAGSLVFWSQWRRPRQTVSGFVEAHDIHVGSRVGGRIDQVLVEEGSYVKKGQKLIVLAPFDLSERRAEAQATWEAKKADLARLERGFRAEEIAQAEARRDQLAARLKMLVAGPRRQEKQSADEQVKIASAALIEAQNKYNRTKRVFDQGQTTADEMDTAIQQLSTAKATLSVREQDLSLANEGTRPEEIDEAKAKLAEAQAAWLLEKNGYRKEEVDEARAAVEAAAAALGSINQQIEELTITAPVDGVIEALDLRRGDLVPPNAPVLSLMDISELWVRAYIPEDWLDRVKLGQALDVTIDSFAGQRFKGKVTFISTTAEFTPRNVQTLEERSKQVFRIKVTLDESFDKNRDKVRPGMIGDVWLGTAK